MTFETLDQSNEKTWPDPKRPTYLCIVNCVRQWALTIAAQDNPGDLWHLRHWLQFWQLRTWIHDNFCYMTIKSDSGQHSQFLRCLAVQRQLNRTHCLSVCPTPLRHLLILTLKSNPRDLWPLRHLIRVIRRHDLTQKDLPTLPTYLPTYICTSIREQPKGAILETCDLWDIGSE